MDDHSILSVPAPASQMQFEEYSGIFGPNGFLETISKIEDQNEENQKQNDEVDIKPSNNSTMDDVNTSTSSGLNNAASDCYNLDEKEASGHDDHLEPEPVLDVDQDLLSQAAALSIELIASKIFERLENSDLFNCRLVSTSWKSFVAPFLQKRVQLNVLNANFSSISTPLRFNATRSVLKSIPGGNTLKGLSALLNSQSNPSTFPCTKFSIYGGYLSDPLVQDFLDLQGLYVTELSLSFSQESLPHESLVMEGIQKLILFQTPNLRRLNLIVPVKFQWEVNCSTRGMDSPLLQSDPEFKEIHQKFGKAGQNTKLKFLQFGENPSAKLVEAIILLAPNLQEIILNECNIDYYIEPSNRLHLLRKLILNPFEGRIEKLEKVLQFLDQEKPLKRLNLSELILHFWEFRWVAEFMDPLFRRRVSQVVNTLLEESVPTLQSIVWDGVTYLEEMKWPKVMPKVTRLKFGNPRDLGNDIDSEEPEYIEPDFGGALYPLQIEPKHVFPRGTEYSKKFPNLRSIGLYADRCCEKFGSLMTFFNFDPIDTVRSVDIYWQNGDWISQEDVANVHSVFPNAIVKRGRY